MLILTGIFAALNSSPAVIRWGSWPSYAALAAGALAAVLFGGAVHRLRYLPPVLSLVAFGMRHGAVDHLVPAWARGRPLGARGLRRLLGAYLGVSVAGVVLWLAAPRAAPGLFLAVAAAHWGTAELWWFPDAGRPLAFAAARGLVPIVVPPAPIPAPSLWPWVSC